MFHAGKRTCIFSSCGLTPSRRLNQCRRVRARARLLRERGLSGTRGLPPPAASQPHPPASAGSGEVASSPLERNLATQGGLVKEGAASPILRSCLQTRPGRKSSSTGREAGATPTCRAPEHTRRHPSNRPHPKVLSVPKGSLGTTWTRNRHPWAPTPVTAAARPRGSGPFLARWCCLFAPPPPSLAWGCVP